MDNNNNIENTSGFEELTNEPIIPAKPKKKYKGFTFKEKLLPTILLSIAFPAITVFFGAFELYGGNTSEFQFSLFDFFGYCILISLAISAILFLSLIFLRGRLFDIVYAVIAWIATMLFVQGNYLKSGIITGFIGDGNLAEITSTQKIVNLIIWVAVGAAFICAFILIKNREIIRTAVTILMVALIAMPLVNFLVISVSTDVYTPAEQRIETDNTYDEPKILTNKYLTEISTNKNVIYFLVDRFDARYAEKAMNEMPELFAELDGFTYYNDNISLYGRTYPSVVYMLTGNKQDFSKSRKEYFKDAYASARPLKLLSENDYKVNLFTNSYYSYDDASVMSEYTANLSGVSGREVVNTLELAFNMIRGSLYFRVPLIFSDAVGNDLSTPLFSKYVVFEAEQPKYETDNKKVYFSLLGGEYTQNTQSNTFSFIHMDGSHLPNLYDKDWNSIDSSHPDAFDEMLAVRVCMEAINSYIAQMKKMGVYDNATIVITGDHAAAISDTKELSGVRRTALFIKKSGDSGTPLTVSEKQVCQDNMWATIFESEGIATEIDFGRSIFDISENETLERTYVFQRMDKDFFENITYKVIGDSSDFDNWEIVERANINGSVHQ